MATPQSGAWNGWVVCPDRFISISITLDVADDGTLGGEYSFSDKAYSQDVSSGELEGSYADDLVTLKLSGANYFQGSFQGQVHPAPPGERQVLSGYIQVFLQSGPEAAILVLFSTQLVPTVNGGWDGDTV